MSQNFGVIVLAAGATPDQRKPKQLLPYLGKTLIEHAARTALASGAREVVIVTGSDACAIRERLRNLPVRVVFNRDWAEGMASSIRVGVGALSSEVGCAVIALCDQPKVTPGLLRDLAERHFESETPIVASSYDGVVGAPCAFGSEVFPQLLALQGQSGARDIIRRSPAQTEVVEFPDGNVDIEEPSGCQLFPIPEIVESPRDTYRDPRDARGPPRLTCSYSYSA